MRSEDEINKLKQENAELKALVAKRDESVTAQAEIILKLKAENERLKKLKCKFKEYCTCNTEKYKQTLQEIKDYLNTLSGIDNDFVNTETYLRILDLITKAESEEE